MGRIRQAHTTPELRVRAVLQQLGLRYRVRNRDLPGSPDIANRRRRWAIFVHGCFWHGHEGCSKATVPKRNRRFWLDKLKANRLRDARAVGALRRQSYATLVIWECQTGIVSPLRKRLSRFLDRSVVLR